MGRKRRCKPSTRNVLPRYALAQLATLKKQITPQSEEPPAVAETPPSTASDNSDTDRELLEKALHGVRPLSSQLYAELTPPKPPPQRLPQNTDSAAQTPKKQPLGHNRSTATPQPPHWANGIDALTFEPRCEPSPQQNQQVKVPPCGKNRHHTSPPLSSATGAKPHTPFMAAMTAVKPLPQHNRIEHQLPGPPPIARQQRQDDHHALTESLQTPFTTENWIDCGEEGIFLRADVPRRILLDLRRGRWVQQDQIDLHGLNRDEARHALAQFMSDNIRKGRRCVRVIHGKGLGSPGGLSVLKQLSRHWLAQRKEVMAFCQAQPQHGGGGALMVLLRSRAALQKAHGLPDE